MITTVYEKSTVKLQEAAAKGKVFPKVEIHIPSNYGGARATYLKYELKNVQVTSVQVNSSSSNITMAKLKLRFEDKRRVR